MVSTAIKRILPNPIKHPLLTCSRWYWYKRGLPAQSTGDIEVFKEAVATVGEGSLRVFEWGSGASTIYYSKFLKSLGREFEWHAIDNSKKWHQMVQKRVLHARLSGCVDVRCLEFPAFWELSGYSPDSPVPTHSYTCSGNVLKYVNSPRELGKRFEMVIVDGRYRRRCLLVAAEVLAPRRVVILHDAQRTHYHSSLASYPHVEFLETGVLPGSREKSAIALCSLDDGSFIHQLAGKYRARWQSDPRG